MKFFKRLIATSVLLSIAGAVSFAQESVPAFEPKDWNYVEKKNDNGTKTAEFHGKFINFVDDSGEWKKINLKPIKDATGFHIKDAPYEANFPLLANGDIKFTSTNRYSIKEKKIRDDAPISAIKKFTGAQPVAGVDTAGGVLYPMALPLIGADILLQAHEMELRYLVRWESLPPDCSPKVSGMTGRFTIPFTQTFADGVVPRKAKDNARITTTDADLTEATQVAVNTFRGIGTPIAHIWDSNGKRDRVKIKQNFKVPILYGQKMIDCSFFEDVIYPVFTDASSTFYPDPNVEVTTVDGQSASERTGGANWTTSRNLATGGSANDSGVQLNAHVGRESGAGEYNIFRNFILFDTSSLTASVTISAASVSLTSAGSTQNNDNDGNDFGAICASSPASNTAITTADYDQITFIEQHDPSERKDWSTMNTAGTVGTWNFNSTGIGNISKTGVSKFSFLEGHDVLNDAYAGSINSSNNINVHSADRSGTADDPYLSVTYTVPSKLKPIIIIKALKDLIPTAFAL